MGRKTVDLIGRFQGAIAATEEVQQHDKRVAELQAEIEELRGVNKDAEKQLTELRQLLSGQSGEQPIELKLIDPNPDQPRQTITEANIQKKMRSLDEHGQLMPIILIPTGDRYLLWDGELRWRAADRLGWPNLRAVFAPMPEDLHRKVLLGFLHQEGLNPLDRAAAIVKEVGLKTSFETSEILKLARSAVRQLERELQRNPQLPKLTEVVNASQKDQEAFLNRVNLREEQREVIAVLVDYQINPQTFTTRDLRMLDLPEDLQQAIRKGLDGSHALQIKRLSAKSLDTDEEGAFSARQQLIDKALQNGLTRDTLKIEIDALLITDNPPEKQQAGSRQLANLTKRLRQAKPWKWESKRRKKYETLLGRLEALLADTEETEE
ncbi:MAG: ParB N-terminal domain-containing protein [Leptolyngbyaceae cyanobacterium MO_188.B28]|nr:ParB N-terminal domain-containing protein [Leptolyngbyaceae cyanobacterium MO_188.B28]